MKLRITTEDLAQLTPDQKQSLQRLWFPKPFELAVAYICTDVDRDEYHAQEFVIGKLEFHGSTPRVEHMTLYDLSLMHTLDEAPEFEEAEEESDSRDEYDEYEADDDETEAAAAEPAIDHEQILSFFYSKNVCLPLLDIGQLIEMLRKMNYGNESFSLTVAKDEEYLSGLSRDGCAPEYEETEICDILWECVKNLL